MADQALATALPIADDIRRLLDATTVLNQAEKQYWLDLLPTMNEVQLQQLKGILEKEQQKMTQIDQKYDQQLGAVAQKYLSRWDEEKARATRLDRQQKEREYAEKSAQQAEELLQQW